MIYPRTPYSVFRNIRKHEACRFRVSGFRSGVDKCAEAEQKPPCGLGAGHEVLAVRIYG
jgi:hypothetical protein